MFGDLLSYVFFALFVYLLFKVLLKGVIPGIFDALKLVAKVSFYLCFGPVIFVFKFLTGTFKEAKRNDNPIGIARETITITDQFKDRKGRTVKVNKTINLGAKSVTKRDLDRIR